MTEHNRRAKYGSVLAVALTAVMVLSLFATPAVAASASVNTANSQINADTLANGDQEIEETISVDSINTSNVTTGDVITVQLGNSGSPASQVTEINEDNLEIVSAEVTDNSSNLGAEASVSNGDVFKTTDDTIDIKLTNYSEGTGEYFDLNVTYEVDQEVSNNAAEYTDLGILTVTNDDTGELPSGANFVTLDVEPGQPTDIKYNQEPSDIKIDAGSTDVIIEAEDDYGNLIVDSNTGEGDISSASTIDYNDTKVAFALDGTSELDTFNKNLDLSNGTNSITATVSDGGDLDAQVGYLEVKATGTDNGTDTELNTITADFDVYPDQVSLTAAEGSFTADTNQTDVTVELQNGTGEKLSDSNIDELDLNYSSFNGNSDGNASLGSVVSAEADSGVDTLESANKTYTFQSFDADTYDIDADVLDNAGETGADKAPTKAELSITVNPGAPAAFDLHDPGTAAYDTSANPVQTLTVDVVDQHENVIDDEYGETETKLTMAGESITRDNTTVHKGATDTFSIDIDNDSANLDAAVGTFDLTVEDASTTTELNSDTETVEIYANVNLKSEETSVNATEKSSIAINLTDVSDATTNVTAASSYDDTAKVVDESVDLELAVSQNGDETTLQSGVTDFSATLAGNDVSNSSNRTVDTSFSAVDEHTLEFSSETAGKYVVYVETRGVGGSQSATKVSTSTITVDAAELDTVEVEPLSDDFVGTIANDKNSYTFNLTLTDQYDNYVDYNTGTYDASNVTVSVVLDDKSNTVAAEDFWIINKSSDGDTNLDDTTLTGADGKVEVTLDPVNDISDSTTGAAMVKATAENSVSGTDDVTVVHEAYGLNDGFNRVSIPQPAAIEMTDTVDHVTTWETENTTYSNEELDLDGTVAGDTELHSGLQVHAKDSNARIGFDFDSESRAAAGEVSLESGWNFVGTNYDIAETPERDLAEDLLTVKEIDEDPNKNEIVKDGGLNRLLNASSSGNTTADLSDAINAGNGEYGTYWVFVEDPNGADYTREIVKPDFNATQRSNNIGA